MAPYERLAESFSKSSPRLHHATVEDIEVGSAWTGLKNDGIQPIKLRATEIQKYVHVYHYEGPRSIFAFGARF